MNVEKKYKSLTIIATILAFFVGCVGMYLIVRYVPMDTTTTKTEKQVTIDDKGIADAVEKVYDSVVTVDTYVNNKKIASGTGFVYKTSGNKAYVLTNNHVIDTSSTMGNSEIHLTFTNGTQVTAKLVGSDQYADIAVLEIDKSKIITVAELGKSEDLRIGDTAFAVGAPLDSAYSWTVTRGIISGKDRMVEVSVGNSKTSDWIMKVIQTDAAINSGNSGGPLVNGNGEVIGINSMKLVSSGVEGMGFAIPIEDALEYAEKIEKGETTVRPFIGITMIDINDLSLLYQNGFHPDAEITSGVLVADVTAGGPADDAGIKKEDVIVAIDGKEVKSIAEFRYNLYKNEPGDTVSIKFIRDKKEKTVKVKLEKNS